MSIRFGRLYGVGMQPQARTVGVVYLSYFLTGVFGALLLRGIVVSGDTAATASHILAHENLYRAGFAFDLVANAIYIALTALLYRFFRPVDHPALVIAVFSSLAGCTLQIAGELLRIAPLVILKHDRLAALFTVGQLQAVALLSLSLHAETLRIAYVLFAVFDLMIGYTIIKSAFVPRVLGYFMIAGGLGGLTLLWPPLALALRYVILPVGGLAELLLMIWLIRGGDRQR
jgi:hypothetical protein